MESSFLELRCKEVVNVVDGKRLGHIVDIVFELSTGNIWNVFKSGGEIFVPYNQICKIGDDTILVELYSTAPRTSNTISFSETKNKKN